MAKYGLGGIVLLVWAAGCSGASMDMASMQAGATPGGSQDVGYFRAQLLAGEIPQADDITLEGFISEHSISNPRVCETPLCLTGAVAHTHNLAHGGDATFIHLSMGSNVDLGSRRRSPMNLAVVVDVSGSMSGENRLQWVKAGLSLMLDSLGPEDRLSVVTYSSDAQVLVGSRFVDNPEPFSEAIASLTPDGSTNLNAGMLLGYQQVAAHASSRTVDRVVLLSDGMVNTGETDDSVILANSATYGSEGIGITTIGVGLNFNHELMRSLSERGGGNFYFIESTQKLQTVFVDELDTVLIPLASDLELRIELSETFTVVDVFGLSYEDEPDGSMVVRVPTVFASKRGGAMLIQVDASESMMGLTDDVIGEISYRYRPFDAAGNLLAEIIETSTSTVPTLDGDVAYQTPGARKTAALWNIVTTFQETAHLVHVMGDRAGAAQLVTELAEYVDAEADDLDDDELRTDRTELINRYAINLGAYLGEPTEFACGGMPDENMYDDHMGDDGHYYMGCAADPTSEHTPLAVLALLVFVAIRRRRVEQQST